jgi:hypothetical protein
VELELGAAQLGLEIARLGKQIADNYQEIANLGVKIKELDDQANDLIKKAGEKTVKASQLRLTIANQARDLAAAQVAALEEATAQAEQMVEQASESLRTMQKQLLAAADKIEDQKRKSGFLSIVKAVINVVGAGLAPFTGGASLAVAQAATMAVNIYEKASNIDFNNLGQAAEAIAGIANDVGKFADLTINQVGVGGDAGKQALADVKAWIKRTETGIHQLEEKVDPPLQLAVGADGQFVLEDQFQELGVTEAVSGGLLEAYLQAVEQPRQMQAFQSIA